jgi:hypothetical protein
MLEHGGEYHPATRGCMQRLVEDDRTMDTHE